MAPRFEGQSVLITGASSGVGAAVATAFARAGADVALLARSREGLESVAAQCRRHGVRALVLPVDVTDAEALADAVARVEEHHGGLDVLVTNAAAMIFGHFTEVAPEQFERTVQVTFLGAVNTIRACLPSLERRAGTIVAVSSINARVPLPTFSSYAASKHALRGFLSTLRIELRAAGSKVTISMVNPGAIDTPLWDNVSTATGRLPHKPPDSYKPEVIATAVLACAALPRADLTVGGEARLLELGWALARPLAELGLGLVDRLYSSGKVEGGDRSMVDPGGVGLGSARATMHGRPSLTLPLRLAADAPRRLFGGRR